MGFLDRLLGRKSEITTSLDLFREVYGGGRGTKAGVSVTTMKALEVSVVVACVRVISDGISQVPWHLHVETNGRRKVASEHKIDRLLYRRPNDWQTSFEFRETLMLHLLLTGNAFVFVNRVGIARDVRSLEIIEPGRVSVKRLRDATLEYTVRADDGSTRVFHRDAIWHLRGPSWNSWMGMDAVRQARSAIGLSIALEEGQSEFQAQGARTSGMLAVKEKLNPEQYDQLSKWLDRHLPEGDRAGKPMIVDRDGTYVPFTMSSADQQLIETRKLQIEEICRSFRVAPLMVGHPADMAARAATESIFLQHVVHCLMPWYQRVEQSADENLLTDDERAVGYHTKLNPNALMRGAAKDQAEYFAKALGSGGSKGWMTQNEVRSGLDLDRSDDPKADELAQQITKQADKATPKAPDDPEPDDED